MPPDAEFVPIPGVPFKPWFTYGEVAVMLQVSEQTLYRRVRLGMIPCPTRFGAVARFSYEDVRVMFTGTAPMNTFKVTRSVRSKGGKKGGKKAAKNRRARAAEELHDEATGGAE